MKLKEVAEIVFSFPEKATENNKIKKKVAVASCFKENNEITDMQDDATFLMDDNLIAQMGDVVIKRIQPQFLNYINNDCDYYIGQNLIVIRSNQNVNSKYLAYIIESNIKNLYTETTGSVLPAIKRKDLDEFDIGELPPKEKQKAIGELWWLNKERQKLYKELLAKEKQQLEYKLKTLTK